MRAPDPGAKLAELLARPLVKVCGLTRQEDVDAAVEAGADLVGFILAQESPRRTDELLDAPETVLRVAVFVGEEHETGADLVQFYAREDGHRARDGVLRRDGEQVGTVVDLPWEADDPTHLERARATRGPRDARRRARTRATSREAIDAVQPVGGRLGPLDRARARHQGPRRCPRLGGGSPMTQTFGAYGGRYVPETLIPALDELTAGWAAARADDSFRSELHELLTNYAGRPTPLTRAARFAPDKRVYLKREDLLHTGAHKLNNALGQAVLAHAARQAAHRRRDRRRPARRRDRHGLRALRARLRRLHGRRGHAPPGSERRADAPARRRGARRSSSARRR